MTASRRDLWLLAAVCLVLAAASLFWLSAVTAPDPNAWLSWSNSLLHGHRIDFAFGPAWKPLPVLLTLPLGTPGKGFAAMSWLLIVRFSILWCSACMYLLVRRDGGALAGVIAAVLPFTIRPWLNVGIAGESETLALALVLTAALSHFAGRRTVAVTLLVLAGLSRPEVWPLIAAYAAWRWSAAERQVAFEAIGGFVLLALCWVVGPKLIALGGDSPFSMSSGHSLHGAGWHTVGSNILGVLTPKAWLLLPFGAIGAILHRRWTVIALAGASVLLIVEITLLWLIHPPISASGYTPVLRYFAAAGVLACGATGYGGEILRDLFPEGAGRKAGSALVIATVAWAALAAIPGARSSVNRSRSTAASAEAAVAALEDAGGAKSLTPCLPYTVSPWSALDWDIDRRLGLPLSASTTRPRVPSIALSFTGGSWALQTRPPAVASGSRIIGRSAGWQVIYYPGPSSGPTGCLGR